MHEVVREAADDSREDDDADRQLGTAHAADGVAMETLTDDDVAEDGENDRQPHGNSVAGDDKVCMKDEIDDPASETANNLISMNEMIGS